MYNQQIINPAYTGIWNKIGFTALVRKQFVGLEKSPLTECISMHLPIGKANAAIGINVINDKFGAEKRLFVLGDYAYEIRLTHKTRLRMGVKFGFENYKNSLTEYKLDPNNNIDEAFNKDVNLNFLPNFGVGIFIFQDNFFAGFSIPNILKNDFEEDFYNYSTNVDAHLFYFNGGYVFPLDLLNHVIFKPTVCARFVTGDSPQIDIAANFLLRETLWLGLTYRTEKTFCITANWKVNQKIKAGLAVDIICNEMHQYQNGTFELSLGYEVDFKRRDYLRTRYF